MSGAKSPIHLYSFMACVGITLPFTFLSYIGLYLRVKFTLEDATKAQKMYNSVLSLTSALDGVGGQRHAPSALSPGKTRKPLYRRLGGPQGRSGRVRKISPPSGFDPRTIQPGIESLYAVPTHIFNGLYCYLELRLRWQE